MNKLLDAIYVDSWMHVANGEQVIRQGICQRSKGKTRGRVIAKKDWNGPIEEEQNK